MNDIIKSLKSIRIETGLNQTELGSKLGLPQSHVSKIEQGSVDPRLSTITDMARLLDQELIMIPRSLLPVVKALLNDSVEQKPMWTPDNDGDEE